MLLHTKLLALMLENLLILSTAILEAALMHYRTFSTFASTLLNRAWTLTIDRNSFL